MISIHAVAIAGGVIAAIFILYHLITFLASNEDHDRHDFKNTCQRLVPTQDLAKDHSPQGDDIAAIESRANRCTRIFSYLQEIHTALIEDCGVDPDKAVQLLEPIPALLMRKKVGK